MTISFPTGLDTLTNPAGSDSLAGHASQHANVNDAIEALEAKVGINGSIDTGSLDYKVENHIGSGGSSHSDAISSGASGFMTGTDKSKLDGVETNANNYTHPGSHPPSIITQDANNRFVTDTEKTAWNAKEPGNANIQTHIGSTSNPHSTTAAQVGLGNVDNTSDATKNAAVATLINKSFGNALTITDNSANPALKVTQTGTGYAFVVEDVASDTTPFVIDSAGRVGIGATPGGDTSFHLSNDITGATTAYSFRALPTVKTPVTTTAMVFQSAPSIESGAALSGGLQHYAAVQGTFTGTTASQFGFLAGSSLVGAANNYGFYGDIPSGTNRYNFYAAGTADNYFAGNVRIGSTLSTAKNAKFEVAGSVLGNASSSALLAYSPVAQTSIMFHVADGALNHKQSEIFADSNGNFAIRSIADDYGSASSVLTALRGVGVAWSSIELNNGSFVIAANGEATVRTAASLGYGIGAGGAVTQVTSKATGVTLNKPCGQIITSTDALASGAFEQFTVTNSLVGLNDTIIINHRSVSANYAVTARQIYAGGFVINIKNESAGSLSDAIPINFAIIKGSAS